APADKHGNTSTDQKYYTDHGEEQGIKKLEGGAADDHLGQGGTAIGQQGTFIGKNSPVNRQIIVQGECTLFELGVGIKATVIHKVCLCHDRITCARRNRSRQSRIYPVTRPQQEFPPLSAVT